MQREKFRELETVSELVDWLSQILTEWKIEYDSKNRRIKKQDRKFIARGVNNALENYIWPARFRTPDSIHINGNNYISGDSVEVYNWPDTFTALKFLGAGLRSAINKGDDVAVTRWSASILEWGMGTRGKEPNLNHLKCARSGPAAYLQKVQSAIDSCDFDSLDAGLVPTMSSGLAKIHSLADENGLIILDSRVALALGSCINWFLDESRKSEIPESLSIGFTNERKPRPLSNGKNQPRLKRDHRWLHAQMKATWILQATLKKSPNLFSGSLPERTHQLEAALFMMGADTEAAAQRIR